MTKINTNKILDNIKGLEKFPHDSLAILENISEHIVIYDSNMVIIWANKAAGDSVNLESRELIGRRCYQIWHQSDQPCPNCPVVRAFKSGESQQSEIETPDGRIWNIHSHPVRDADGKIVGVVELTQEITLRKKAERALAESEKSYRSLFESSLVGWWRTRIEDGLFLKANPAAVKVLGFEHESDLINKHTAAEFYPAEERNELTALLAKSGEVDGFEAHFTVKNGVQKTVLLSAKIFPEKGYIEGSVVDITGQEKALEALGEAVQKHDELYDNLRDGAVTVDMNGRIIECNKAFRNMLGYTMEEIFKLTYNDITPEKWHAFEAGIVEQQVLTRGFSDNYEKEYRRKDGSIFPVELRTYLIKDRDGAPSGMWAFVRDITERKRSEDLLQESQQMLKLVLDSIPVRVFWKDKNSVYLGCNKVFAKDAGVESPEDIVGKTDYDLAWKKEEADLYRKYDAAVISSDQPQYHIIEPQLHSNGTEAWLDTNKIPLHDSSGAVVGVLGTYEDITERKRADEFLKRSERRYRSLVETITEGMSIVDFDENILFANSAACDILGYSREELIGMNLRQLIIPEDINKILSETENRKKGITSRYDFSIKRKDGMVRDLHISVTPYQDIDGNIKGAIGLFSDITNRNREKSEKIKLKEQLDRAQRMESLGILAGGVAHDLNNILGPLVAYPEMILMKLPQDSPARRQVELLGKSARDAADVIQDLLTLARRGRYEMIPTDINEVIKSYLNSANMIELKERNPNVKVDVALDKRTGKISGSTPHLLKVIMNMVVNAFDAMPGGGELKIETGHAHLDRLYGGYTDIIEGDYVIVRVRDTGIGIEEKHLKCIFEPYYSKKEMGSSGSGLGLSVVYGIVKDHKGYYDVNSTIGVGTEFILYFPVSNEDIKNESECNEEYGGTEKILVIDDVVEQRDVARELLSSLGYQIATVSGGREAVEYMKDNHADLIILDMIMEKDFDGLDTYREILKANPGQKAIIVSGFSATERVKQALELGAGQYIKKPYNINQLGQAIRSELDKQKVPSIP